MLLTRRELLTTFLGAPLAIAACSRNKKPRFPHGEIVGQNVAAGHVIREDRQFEVPTENWETAEVAIIGAGIAGLSAAWRLHKKGLEDFVVFELEKEAGGTSVSGRGEPVNYPWAAHYLPVPFRENQGLIELLDEMSLIEGRTAEGDVQIKEEYLCREPQERVFYKGRWYEGLYLHAGESEDDKSQFEGFQRAVDSWVNWRDDIGRRAFTVPLANCSNSAEATQLDRISFAAWLRQNGYSSSRLLWYCDYACRDDYGTTLEQTSAWAGLFYFCSRVRQGGDESQSFITFPEGNGRFVGHFVEIIGEKIQKDHTAVSVVSRERGADLVSITAEGLRGFHCKKVIFASPIFTAPHIIRGFRENPPFAAGEFQHNSWFVANLFLNDRPKLRSVRDFPLAWDNVIYESPSLGYVTATHQKGIDYGPTILTYYYPMCHEPDGRTKLFDYEWAELADVCLTDVARAHPDVYDLCERLDVMRWGHAMISPRPNFIWSGIRETAVRPWRNVHFAHTDLSGIALFEEAFHHGLRAADDVLNALP